MSSSKRLTKTQQAFNEIALILKEISADGIITVDEFKRIMQWRVNWRTVVRREELRSFDNWLVGAIADGKVDKNEKIELLEWAKKIQEEFNKQQFEDDVTPVNTFFEYSTDEIPSWQNDPITDRQFSFLIDLGETEENCRSFSKGTASKRIDELLYQRNQKRNQSIQVDLDQIKAYMIIAIVILVILVIIFLFK
jgi:hypothetical protein